METPEELLAVHNTILATVGPLERIVIESIIKRCAPAIVIKKHNQLDISNWCRLYVLSNGSIASYFGTFRPDDTPSIRLDQEHNEMIIGTKAAGVIIDSLVKSCNLNTAAAIAAGRMFQEQLNRNMLVEIEKQRHDDELTEKAQKYDQLVAVIARILE